MHPTFRVFKSLVGDRTTEAFGAGKSKERSTEKMGSGRFLVKLCAL
jgi:hypothetical protein